MKTWTFVRTEGFPAQQSVSLAAAPPPLFPFLVCNLLAQGPRGASDFWGPTHPTSYYSGGRGSGVSTGPRPTRGSVASLLARLFEVGVLVPSEGGAEASARGRAWPELALRSSAMGREITSPSPSPPAAAERVWREEGEEAGGGGGGGAA